MKTFIIGLCLSILCFTTTAYAANVYECRQAERAIKKQLRDPDSAKFECSPLIDGNGGKVMLVRVNSKNAFGGYTGWQDWGVVFMPDKTIEAYSPEMMKKAGW